MMTRVNFKLLILCVLFLEAMEIRAMSIPTHAEVSVPSPAAIVLQSATIVHGRLSRLQSSVLLMVEESIKGSAVKGERFELLDQSHTMGFQIDTLVPTQAHNQVLVFSNLNPNGRTLILSWLHASVWPPQVPFRTLPGKDFEEYRNFVLDILAYEQMSRSHLVGLANQLIRDVEGDKVYAALDFADVAWLKSASKAFDNQAFQVPWAMYAKLRKRLPNQYIEEKVRNMIGLFPASILIADILRNSNKSLSQSRDPTLEALFRAKGWTKARKLSIKELVDIFDAHRRKQQRQDAQVALQMYDSQATEVATATDLLLEAILATQLPLKDATKPPADKKRLWQELIDRMLHT